MNTYIKIVIIIAIYSVSYMPVRAQQDSPSTDTGDLSSAGSRPLLELSVRREDAKYYPHQYYEHNNYTGFQISDIAGNQASFTPFDIRIKSASRGWGVDLSYQSFSLRNYGYNELYIGSPNYSYFSRHEFMPLKREDLQLLGFFYAISNRTHELGIGPGIRNTNLSKGYNYGYSYYSEKFYNYGPEVDIKYTYRFASRFSIALQVGYFFTIGKRLFESGGITYDDRSQPVPEKSWGSPSTKGVLEGFDSRATLSFALSQNIKLDLGYHYSYGWFHYINYYVIALPYSQMFYDNFYSPEISDPKHKGYPDIIRGVSLGMTVATEF